MYKSHGIIITKPYGGHVTFGSCRVWIQNHKPKEYVLWIFCCTVLAFQIKIAAPIELKSGNKFLTQHYK